MGRSCEIVYMDGKREKLELKLVCYYDSDGKDFNFLGTGCRVSYLIRLLQEQKPILLARNFGESNIERIINTCNIRSIEKTDQPL